MHQWLQTGSLSGSFVDFIVEPNPHQSGELDSYSLIASRVPGFLKSKALLVLQIGSFQRILKRLSNPSCIIVDRSQLMYSQGRLDAELDLTFKRSSAKLLEVIDTEKALASTLQFLRDHFLLFNADPINALVGKLDIILSRDGSNFDERTFRVNFEAFFPEQCGLNFSFSTCDVYDQLLNILRQDTGAVRKMSNHTLRLFCLEFDPGFPLNIVITAESMSKYKILFRHLFGLNLLISELSKKRVIPGGTGKAVFSLRFSMQTFIQKMHSYNVYSVLAPQYETLVASISQVSCSKVTVHILTILCRLRGWIRSSPCTATTWIAVSASASSRTQSLSTCLATLFT